MYDTYGTVGTVKNMTHIMLAFAVVAVLGVGATSPVPAPATLLWASHPTFANETVLVWGASLTGTTSAVLVPLTDHQAASSAVAATATTIPVFDVSDTSFKATLPPMLAAGLYTLCARGPAAPEPDPTAIGSNATNCIVLNAPDMFWYVEFWCNHPV